MSDAIPVAIRGLSFAHEGASAPLFTDLTVHLPAGMTGVVGANGAGKSTLLRLLCGRLAPTAGRIEGAATAVYCEQRTDAAPPDLPDLLADWSPAAFRLRGRLGVEPDFADRWSTLSHGERKRAQIACALWRQPAVLAIDEPTNHLDEAGRAMLVEALSRFRGVGLIVSHDRALLDALCVQCVWLEPPGASVYAGGYTEARDQRRRERETLLAEYEKASRAHRALQHELAVRRERASREHQVRSKRGLDRHDADGREKIDRARIADGKAGAPLRQLQGRSAQTAARLAAARVDHQHRTGVRLSAEPSRRNALFRLPAGSLELGGGRRLRHPDLLMRPQDRLALTGPNGAGKSTLTRRILAELDLPAGQVIHLPQEIAAADAAALLAEARTLPPDRLGAVMTLVSRLGSRPERLLETSTPSPGEVRKLLLALGMSGSPRLLVLDEPTNHLDLPSIEAVEAALHDATCGLLIVSHDRPFLDRLTRTEWRIDPAPEGDSVLVTP